MLKPGGGRPRKLRLATGKVSYARADQLIAGEESAIYQQGTPRRVAVWLQ